MTTITLLHLFPSFTTLSHPPFLLPPKLTFKFNSSSSRFPSQLGFSLIRSQFSDTSFADHDGDSETAIEVLRVPDHWSEPSRAHQESEWLRVTLHKWLDDEYCPEPTNVDISRVAAKSYYQSLMQKTTDLGDILLRMARELESLSYQESFHGPFSSANAAVSLIAQRIEHE